MNLSERMKRYESVTQGTLQPRTPAILRLDGRCFHTFTKTCSKPYDIQLAACIDSATMELLGEVQGAQFAYCQSDEISVLITDYQSLEPQAWFGGKIQKICSVSAAILSTEFSSRFGTNATFDARVFNLPKEEVTNYFIWRQKDCQRNAIQSLARTYFSHKECHGLNCEKLKSKLSKIGVEFQKQSFCFINGRFVVDTGQYPAPIFTSSREVVEQYV